MDDRSRAYTTVTTSSSAVFSTSYHLSALGEGWQAAPQDIRLVVGQPLLYMDRWEQIENAYHAARRFRGEDRSRFLDEHQGLDSAMRRTVETLLEHDEVTDGFLNRPAVELAAEWESLTGSSATLTGRTVGSFQVLERIGSGGMGHIYRARDRTLQRDVALKVQPPLFTLNPDRLARFKR